MKPNPGHCPEEAKGKRVRVRLVNGNECGAEPVSAAVPAGWAADGRHGCNWKRDPSNPFSITHYEVI